MAKGSWMVLAGAGVGLVLVAGAAVRGLLWLPDPVEEVHVHCAPSTPMARGGQALRVLVWNVQYGASTRHRFFYDGGEAVHVPVEDVRWTLDEAAGIVRDLDPDVILFQEVDRGSDRTGRIDQHAELLARLDYPCHVSAPYHRSPFVPHPSHEPLGRVDMHLSVFSRVRLGTARRHQLPLLRESWLRQLFNLRRAVLDVRVPVAGGPDLTLLDTHLSAFSHGDGTLPRQIAVTRRLAHAAAREGRGVLLAGDFNALPPGVDGSTLSVDADLYPEDSSPITVLYEDDVLTPAVSLDAMRQHPERTFTYAPHGLGRTDRTIDHVFVAGGVSVRDVVVRQDRVDVSDHQPILVEVRIPGDDGG